MRLKIYFVISLVIFAFFKVNGQSIPSGGRNTSDTTEAKNFSFMPIPYVNYSRSLGFAFGAIPMAMYKINPKDTISPDSMTGLMGVYTSNDTWFALFFQKFYLKEDNWRITTAGGLGSLNFQFYLDIPLGGYIDYNTQADFFFVEIQRKIVNKLYVGAHYTYTKFNTSFGSDAQLSLAGKSLHGLGIKLSHDKRDDVYYPRNGTLSEIDWTSYPDIFNEESSANKIELEHNQYFSVRKEKDVLAARAYAGLGIGDLAFEQQFVVGSQDIRGYSHGKYRGDYLLAIQGEYRWNFHKKLSAVGFLGVATIFGSINDSDDGVFLPGIGTGFRYNVFPKNHMNVGLDIAGGKDDWGFYFRIGESF